MWKLASKDLKVFFDDTRAMALTFLLPIGLITLFALAFGGIGKSDDSKITLLTVDEDQSAASRGILEHLDSITALQLEPSTQEAAAKQIQSGSRIACLIIHKGFADSLADGGNFPVEMLYDAGQVIQASIVKSIVEGLFSQLQGQSRMMAGASRMVDAMMPFADVSFRDSVKAQIRREIYSDPKQKDAPVISATGVVGGDQQSWGLIQAVAGTAVMMLLFSVSAIGASIIQEKEDGVLRKLLQSPLHPYAVLSGKMLSGTLISCMQLCIMFLFAWLAFGLHLFINIPALLLMIFATAITCASLGILLASIATSKRQVDAMRTMVILFMSAIGGSMVPLFIMPLFMQHLAVISVNYWSIQGFYDIFWRKLPIASVAQNAGVLLGMTLLFSTLSFYLFRKNILQIA